MTSPGAHPGGPFIVFEGIDGSGTTTQAERYAAHLRARGHHVRLTREPSTGPVGSLIRLILTHRTTLQGSHQAALMALLFAADRVDHVDSEIDPHIEGGGVVISDRYDLSSLAYQSAGASDDELRDQIAWIRTLNQHVRRPDVTVVLDVSPAVAAARRHARGGAGELFDAASLQARLAAVYLRAEDLVPGDRVVHIDGDRDVESVTRAVKEALEPFVEV